MNAVLLTTDTTHHRFFVQETARVVPWGGIPIERKVLRAPFETYHSFESEREAFERDVCFPSGLPEWDAFGPVFTLETANDAGAIAWLAGQSADTAVVFGTGRLRPEVSAAHPRPMYNLHGGDPESYRGLDSHLWAIYHGDFEGQVTTLHEVNAALDDGAILDRCAVPIT